LSKKPSSAEGAGGGQTDRKRISALIVRGKDGWRATRLKYCPRGHTSQASRFSERTKLLDNKVVVRPQYHKPVSYSSYILLSEDIMSLSLPGLKIALEDKVICFSSYEFVF